MPVVDADVIAHDVMAKGRPAHKRVVAAFREHPGVVTADGDIDRAALRALIFSDRALNRKLKQCTHAAIAFEMLAQIFRHSVLRRQPVVVLDAPLLFESRSDLLCKHTIVVHCAESTQIARLAQRDACKHALLSCSCCVPAGRWVQTHHVERAQVAWSSAVRPSRRRCQRT